MNQLNRYFQIISLLGFNWVLYRALYAAQICLGLMEKRSPVRKWGELDCRITDKFFTDFIKFYGLKIAVEQADQILAGNFLYFSHHQTKLSFPPDWPKNPFSTASSEEDIDFDRRLHWSQISEFLSDDIKGVWEIGRFACVGCGP